MNQSPMNLLLDKDFWKTSTVENVDKILDSGTDIEARFMTLLHAATALSENQHLLQHCWTEALI